MSDGKIKPLSKCGECGQIIDWDDDGGHIYEGVVICPPCEGLSDER
jgi:hypothetical protein